MFLCLFTCEAEITQRRREGGNKREVTVQPESKDEDGWMDENDLRSSSTLK